MVFSLQKRFFVFLLLPVVLLLFDSGRGVFPICPLFLARPMESHNKTKS